MQSTRRPATCLWQVFGACVTDCKLYDFLRIAELRRHVAGNLPQRTTLGGNETVRGSVSRRFMNRAASDERLALAGLETPHDIDVGTVPGHRIEALHVEVQPEVGVETLGVGRQGDDPGGIKRTPQFIGQRTRNTAP